MSVFKKSEFKKTQKRFFGKLKKDIVKASVSIVEDKAAGKTWFEAIINIPFSDGSSQQAVRNININVDQKNHLTASGEKHIPILNPDGYKTGLNSSSMADQQYRDGHKKRYKIIKDTNRPRVIHDTNSSNNTGSENFGEQEAPGNSIGTNFTIGGLGAFVAGVGGLVCGLEAMFSLRDRYNARGTVGQNIILEEPNFEKNKTESKSKKQFESPIIKDQKVPRLLESKHIETERHKRVAQWIREYDDKKGKK